MADIKTIIRKMKASPNDVRYADLCKVCDHYFGEARHKGTSHRVYKMTWRGDPRVNIQKLKNGKAKEYQVKQVLQAIARKDNGG